MAICDKFRDQRVLFYLPAAKTGLGLDSDYRVPPNRLPGRPQVDPPTDVYGKVTIRQPLRSLRLSLFALKSGSWPWTQFTLPVRLLLTYSMAQMSCYELSVAPLIPPKNYPLCAIFLHPRNNQAPSHPVRAILR